MILSPKLPANQRAIQDSSKWPQTEQVFEAKKVNFNDHQWVQRGNMLHHICEGCMQQAIRLPFGKMLVKKNGRYDLVDEKSWGIAEEGPRNKLRSRKF